MNKRPIPIPEPRKLFPKKGKKIVLKGKLKEEEDLQETTLTAKRKSFWITF